MAALAPRAIVRSRIFRCQTIFRLRSFKIAVNRGTGAHGMMTIHDIRRGLQTSAVGARALAEQCLTAIKAEGGEGPRTFLKVNESTALAAADQIDALRKRVVALPQF